MANEEHLELIRQGVDAWNRWRRKYADTRPDLVRAYLSRANLIEADLVRADLSGASLNGADLSRAILVESYLTGAFLIEANLSSAYLCGVNLARADLAGADLSGADLSGAHLLGANLSGANLSSADLKVTNLAEADLSGANLIRATLMGSCLVKTDLRGANLTDCSVHGVSAWGLRLEGATQSNLLITPPDESAITVDNLEVAQFIYLLLNNQKIRQVIDTITSKVVLILGRFTEERKRVLDAIREELRKHDYIPVLFDFEKPAGKDITGTVETLARMARFVIADLTDPSSIPHELGTIVPFLRTTPVLPIRVVGSTGYSMFEDLRRSYNWVLDIHEYADSDSLISTLPKVIAPADKMAEELRRP
jgi:uncharacterized protein YjbI with pentapeptide repeats